MKHPSLFERLCGELTLLEAWKMVKAKNTAGGIDGFSVRQYDEDIGNHLAEIITELRAGKWEPYPYLRVEIPKSNNEKRRLGLLSVKDKIVQQAILNLIHPRLDCLFLNNSYGYRPGKGPVKAVNRTRDFMLTIRDGWVLRLDVDNFFDTVNHEILFGRLAHYINDEEMCRLVHLCVTMGNVSRNDKWLDNKAGLPQGALLSPLLGLMRKKFLIRVVTAPSYDCRFPDEDTRYVRYADDFVLFATNEDEARMWAGQIATFLQSRLQLALNQPYHIAPCSEGFEFLGIRIKDTGYSLSDKKLHDLTQRIGAFGFDANGVLDASSIKSYSGIKNYYGRLLPQALLKQFDDLLVQRLKQLVAEHHDAIANKSVLEASVGTIDFMSDECILNKKELCRSVVEAYLKASANGSAISPAEQNRRIVTKRKVEFHRREAEGAELILNTPGTFLSVAGGSVLVKKQNAVLSKHPLSALRHITVLTRGVSLSSNMVDVCVEHKIPIDFFDGSGKHKASVLAPKYMEATLWGKQAAMADVMRFELGRRILVGKVRNQLNLVKYYDKYHSRDDHALAQTAANTIALLDQWLEQLKGIDFVDNYREALMAVEAQSASVYWQYIRTLVADDGVGFEQRVRQGATDLFNAMLNYGYALLYARVWQALLAAKLNPYHSVIHVRQQGKPTLVFDVVELFRAQAVDRVVVSMVQKHLPLHITQGKLSADTRAMLAKNIIERFNRYEKYRGEEMLFSQIIHRQASELARTVESGATFKPYIGKW